MSSTPLLIAPRGRDVLGSVPVIVAALGTVVGFGLLGGPAAAAIGLLPAVAVVAGGPLLAFAVGTVALAGLGGAVGLPPVAAAVVLAGLLCAELYEADGPRIALLFAAVVGAVVGGFLGIRATGTGLLGTAAVVGGALALGSYLLHRYELVALGLVEPEGTDG